ncbi:uncharacterized protein [Macrobrachium rosenbergii]|uniref:uncharacterized protein n=1 Tax=Macrobrachium rosenbergii TaxID=79674 RepID=UPI0034D5D1E1
MKDETINHAASESPALAQNQYKKRHYSVAKDLHWSLCKKHQLYCNNKWYDHQPEGVIEIDEAKTLWDYSVRPDLTLIDKIKKKVSLTDVALPWDTRVDEEESEKIDKYQDLKIEIRRMLDMPVEIVPIITGTLGTIPRSLKGNLNKLDVEVAPGLMQKSVLLETAYSEMQDATHIGNVILPPSSGDHQPAASDEENEDDALNGAGMPDELSGEPKVHENEDEEVENFREKRRWRLAGERQEREDGGRRCVVSLRGSRREVQLWKIGRLPHPDRGHAHSTPPHRCLSQPDPRKMSSSSSTWELGRTWIWRAKP